MNPLTVVIAGTGGLLVYCAVKGYDPRTVVRNALRGQAPGMGARLGGSSGFTQGTGWTAPQNRPGMDDRNPLVPGMGDPEDFFRPEV